MTKFNNIYGFSSISCFAFGLTDEKLHYFVELIMGSKFAILIKFSRFLTFSIFFLKKLAKVKII